MKHRDSRTESDPPPDRVAHVADLLDALRATDVGTAIEGLEDLLVRLRPAEEIRAELACVDGPTLRAAFALRAGRPRVMR